jgi:hypothetical protein
MTSFFKTAATILIEFRKFMETISLNKLHSWCLQGHNSTRIRDLNVKCLFCRNLLYQLDMFCYYLVFSNQQTASVV